MSERFVDIDGDKLLYYVNRAISRLQLLVEEEESKRQELIREQEGRYRQALQEYDAAKSICDAWAARPWWMRIGRNAPPLPWRVYRSDYVFTNYLSNKNVATLRYLESMRKAVNPELTYHLDTGDAISLRLGLEEYPVA